LLRLAFWGWESQAWKIHHLAGTYDNVIFTRTHTLAFLEREILCVPYIFEAAKFCTFDFHTAAAAAFLFDFPSFFFFSFPRTSDFHPDGKFSKAQ